jgi:peptide-methionine (R)-S-oxide reductase
MSEFTNKTNKTDAQWKQELDPETYRITREKGTEPAFSGKL